MKLVAVDYFSYAHRDRIGVMLSFVESQKTAEI